MFHMR